MWTQEELEEIIKRAELDASQPGYTDAMRHAFLGLAAAADRLKAIEGRVERGEMSALVTPPPASAG